MSPKTRELRLSLSIQLGQAPWEVLSKFKKKKNVINKTLAFYLPWFLLSKKGARTHTHTHTHTHKFKLKSRFPVVDPETMERLLFLLGLVLVCPPHLFIFFHIVSPTKCLLPPYPKAS